MMSENNSFDCLIGQIDSVSKFVQRDRGTIFEKLVLTYLTTEPTYRNLYSNVWLLADVPAEYGIPKQDNGVDLVAMQFDGKIVAIQAKFHKSKIAKSEINSFVAELGKSYYQTGLIVSTVDEWSANAIDTINLNEKGISLIGLSDLRNSQIDWSSYSLKRPEVAVLKEKKNLRSYQSIALKKAEEHFEKNSRGQLVMAPGTGKTFTSLKIIEEMMKKEEGDFYVLYLIPSIQLLTQTLRSWNNDTSVNMVSMAVTSDRDASRGEDGNEDIKASDIGFPATTSPTSLYGNWKNIPEVSDYKRIIVVFCTYHSLDVIKKAQNLGFPTFDFIISDEAHRTTGAHELTTEASFFTKIHESDFVVGRKRLYQTATPKIYGESAKKNAKDKSILLSSMDDHSKFGEVFYRMGFGQAVSQGILTDYKVMVLAVDEEAIQKDMQQMLSDPDNGLNIDDVGRIIGIWNGMMRRNGYKNPIVNSPFDGLPLERAIAFTRTIKDSKKVTEQFETVVNEYIGKANEKSFSSLSMRHADGMMNSLQKGEILDWLSDSNKPSNEARIVSNVRFLTEGIDVPTLDAVIFLAPKKSQVDIVQAVGRIMRKSENKHYGYIILPVVVPSGEAPESILDNNKNYSIVWQIINALRSVDERFEAMVDKINISKPKQLEVIGIGPAPKGSNLEINENSTPKDYQTKMNFDWESFEGAIYGKIVEKVGNRRYLEDWTSDVAKIAERQIKWILNRLKDKDSEIKINFNKFVQSLQHNINESISEVQAAEMLSQHLITKPIFEALFSDYSFVNNNPVSLSMEKIVDTLEKSGFTKEQENLQPLYESVKMRAYGVEKTEDKQKIIINLYEGFFKTAFEKTSRKMGIVYTPIEVVDFIVKSADNILIKHFDKSLISSEVHILDPFTGTGTFIVRLLNYFNSKLTLNEVSIEDIEKKYTHELHANEIILLSYYIAAINIESAFNEMRAEKDEYLPFEGIVLTDTFESTENNNTLDETYFGTNDKRLKVQLEKPITVILGNPPYSAKQKNEDDNQEKQSYTKLDASLTEKWVVSSTATNKNNLYDSYIRALRWSADRMVDNGVIGFITNNSFIDGNAMDGMRKNLLEEFSDVYIINLKGAIRGKTKNQILEEGENIFDIMTGVAIVFLVKNFKNQSKTRGDLHYIDIGNGLSKKEKLEKLSGWSSIKNIESDFLNIVPNQKGDWINQRNSNFDSLIKVGDKKNENALFIDYTGGIKTGRDSWSWGYSKDNVIEVMNRSIEYYNDNIGDKKVYSLDTKAISWTQSLKRKFEAKEILRFSEERIYVGMYRPFTKKFVYYDQPLVDRQYQMPKVFPNSDSANKVISLANKTSGKPFSSLVTDVITDVNLFTGGSQNLPFMLIDNLGEYSAVRINILEKLTGLTEQDVHYYIYGLFHSKDYEELYSDDLAKSFVRIPNLKFKEEYIQVGKKLEFLHLNYETQESWPSVKVKFKSENPDFRVEKMKFLKSGEFDVIVFNDDITISNIPLEAYDYVVNGRSAISWVMDQYQIRYRKDSDTTDDPNCYCNDPKYILNLLLSVITVSMETQKIILELPIFEEI